MMMRVFKAAAGAVATAALLATALSGAQAADYKEEYKVSTVVPAPFPWGLAAEKWVELVRERSDGRINMKVYPGAQLVSGDQTKEFSAMRQGIIDMAVGSTINWSPQVKELNIFSMPFLMPDHAAIDALTQGPVGKELFDIIEKRGVVPLGWAENGFRELTNSKRDIKTPADLNGLKIRVVGSPLYLDTFTALGANPTQMSWADAQPALATGAVDGQENPLSIFTVAKLQNVGQKHVTLWGYVADPLIFGVSKRVWDTFTPEDQDLLRKAAQDAGTYGIEVARKGITEKDDSTLKEIEGLGVTITRLSDAERQAFVDATRGVYDKWAKEIGPDLVKTAEESVANRKK
ncbi:DctP family TRAP transporter solute-binding subunit [uncultured Tistrella sp.]|uniref:DctP family TRAP transporter solute-binding subunit n=1 Tax=Tistrella mobilis TaxID=171437 RepID=UPI000C0AF53E|nr:DctP family TRAP transporter solute-binding subunit [uncultured Tistrella sp.]MAM74089.1 C4-dicarboxylate ABC transporter [Tistrella sp.]